MKKYVSVTLKKTATFNIIAQVNTELAGRELENAVLVPDQFFEEWFGDEAEDWEVDDVQEVTPDWDWMKLPMFERERQEAPVFEIQLTVVQWAIRGDGSGTWMMGNGEWSEESAACQLFSSEAEAESFARQHSIEKFTIIPFEL